MSVHRCFRSHRLTVTTAAILTLLAFAVPGRSETVLGTVRDAADGAPLRSMVVTSYNAGGTVEAQTTTDAGGSYALDLPAGKFRLLAYDPAGIYATCFAGGAPSFDESPELTLPSQVARLDFAMERAGTISGTVYVSSVPTYNVTVAAYNLSGTRRSATQTDSAGDYSLVLPPGDFKLVAFDSSGFVGPEFFKDRNSFVEADPIQAVRGEKRAGADFELGPAAHISGVATNPAGIPLAGVLVYAYTASGEEVRWVTTNSTGQFDLTLSTGSYRVVAADPSNNYSTTFLDGASSFQASPALTLAPWEYRQNLTVVLPPAGRLTGRVIARSTRAPLQNMTIAAFNTDGSRYITRESAADGTFVLPLPSREFRIAAWDDALVFAPQFYPLHPAFRASSQLIPEAGHDTALLDFELDQGARVSGNLSAATGPVSNATVAAYDAEGYVAGKGMTSPAGAYRFVVPAGEYRIVASDDEQRFAVAFENGALAFDGAPQRTLQSGTDQQVDFTLTPGAVLAGVVRDGAQIGLPRMQVTLLQSERVRVATMTTADDGTFRIAVVPGQYRVVVSDPAGSYRQLFYGGDTYATATPVNAALLNPQNITVTMQKAIPARKHAAGR